MPEGGCWSISGPTWAARGHIHQAELRVRKSITSRTVRYHPQINLFLSRLNEPQRRWYVAVISEAADSPSDRQLSLITGLDEKTIQRGRHELAANLVDAPDEGQRHAGGGRPRAEKKIPR